MLCRVKSLWMFLSVHALHGQVITLYCDLTILKHFQRPVAIRLLFLCNCYCSHRGTSRPSQTLKEITFLTQNVHLSPSWNKLQLYTGRVPSLLIYCFTKCALVTSCGFQFLLIMTVVTNFISEALGSLSEHTTRKKYQQNLYTKFRLYTDTAEGNCQIFVNQLETLDKCSFNASLPLVMIVHGWSVWTHILFLFHITSNYIYFPPHFATEATSEVRLWYKDDRFHW